ncbi:hypothetical protein DIQ35_20330, partial [Acinetobacter baumannii]|uniref:hypothetical protein n=1 Tax=Acinetobacter baumannii TaxID=470 RepID=UPI00148F413E
PSIEPASPTINFKIEVINQVSGATVEAEQLDEQTVRIIVKDELDKQLPRTVPKLVSCLSSSSLTMIRTVCSSS